MTDHDLTDLVRPRMEVRVTTIPITRTAWIAYSDGTISGPYPAVAVAFALASERVSGVVNRSHYFNRREQEREVLHTSYEVEPDFVGDQLEFASAQFLVLPDDAGEWESLWVDQSIIAFSRAAAETLAKKRQEKAQAEVAS